MLAPITLTLILNSLTLTLSIGCLILILWHDSRRITNLYFAWFLTMVLLWQSGSLLARAAALTGVDEEIVQFGLQMLEVGFTNAALALYLYVVILTGNRSRRLQIFGLISILGLLIYYGLFFILGSSASYSISLSGALNYNFTFTSILAFGAIDVATLAMVWQGFRRIQRPALAFGVMLLCLGQLAVLVSPRLRELAIAEDAGALATMVMAFALVQSQIIQPLAGQSRQIKVVRDVGLAITSRLRLQSVLQAIAAQAAALLKADASIIFLSRDEEQELVLAAQYNIHRNLLGHRLAKNAGLAGQVVLERRPSLLTDYRRQWKGEPDTPFAEQGFGSIIAVPLIFGDDVVGVLLVIDGPESRIFELEDVRLLELLAPQAAVAITNSRLFEQERALTDELEVAKTRLETFLLSTDNPVVALDKHLRVMFANEAATRLVPEAAETVREKTLLDLVPHNLLPRNPRRMLHDLKKTRSFIYEVALGGHVYLCHVARITHPEKGWVVVLNDVSSLKELERLQRQMIELTTHQLKNPLQAAMLHLDELEDLGSDVLTDDMRYDMTVIEEQLDRMRRLIEGILNLERLQNRSKPREEQVDLALLTQEVISDLRGLAQKKQIELRFEPVPQLSIVVGDPGELTEAISNLIDNAIKYTPPFGSVQIASKPLNGHILLNVQDTGIGIPEMDQAHVFERFYRAEQPGTEQIGGTGMGLSLVKAIVEAHRGRIWLESELNHGTTFYIELPSAM
jgi:two-component system, OmpR family, phosphate regulon sensor histidine kinase PhoR